MELEITPEPTPEERRAIELALAAPEESAWPGSLDGGAAAEEPRREPRVVEP